MHSSSPKWLTIDISKSAPNYVNIGQSSAKSNSQQYTPKANIKKQQSLFKSNFLSRYSSQEDLQGCIRPKCSVEELDNSPKSQQDHLWKRTNYFPRKSNEGNEKKTFNFRPQQGKRKSNMMAGQQNLPFFKNSGIQQKGIKHLKQTASTNSTDNIGYAARSEKTIPSFLKNSGQIKKKGVESAFQKHQEYFSAKHRPKFFSDQLSIDNFYIIRKLGQGKFGSVFLALDKMTGFIVAIKMVEKKRVVEQNFLTQFIREIKIQAFLEHPNIAKVYGFFHDTTHFYSIMELGEGGQLYDVIKNGQTLSQESTSFIIGNLLDSIIYLHQHKILHRDIKPQNIVLVHGNVKLCDFGWAVYKKGELRSTFCGTPLYLSPQLLNGEKYDQKVDLWALGILAFQLHLGTSPFNIQSQEDLLKILTNDIQYPEDYHVSKNFKQFISAVLQKDPKRRLEAKKLMQLKFIKRYRELQTCQQLCQ